MDVALLYWGGEKEDAGKVEDVLSHKTVGLKFCSSQRLIFILHFAVESRGKSLDVSL